MKLLDPNEIRQEKSESAEQAQMRTQKLAAEESRLAREINLARESAKVEIEKINAEVAEHIKIKGAERAAVDDEVAKLRAEREKLLKPVDDILAEANATLERAKKISILAELKNAELHDERDDLQDAREALQDVEDDFKERTAGLMAREERIAKEEARIKASADKLSADWVGYHKAALELNGKSESLIVKSEGIRVREEAIEIRRKEQDERDAKLYNEKRAIQSGYAALEQAKIHLGIKT